MKRVNEATEKKEKKGKEGRQMEFSKEGKAKYSSGAQVAYILTKCPHLCLINKYVHSHMYPRAHRYKTIITSPGKLMERQIKN